MFENEIRILEFLNEKSDLSQRDLSKKTNLSLGKINYTIKKMIEEGYIIHEKRGNKVIYKLTEEGFKLIDEHLKYTKIKKINLHNEEFLNVKTAVILAAGKAMDFDCPVSLLDIGKTTLIERTIKLLFKENIKNIVIITGYKSENFKTLLNDKRIRLIYNEKYKWTGTMHSLSLAKDVIKEDFLLIESDIIFEEKALKYLIENKNRDCILVTNETGSGDEAFVEISDNYIYKITKDIHQLNKIDGEMIGISKISYEVFSLMIEEFKTNRNPYLNYEYLLMDIGRNYKIGYIKIDDLIWYEIDNLKQYDNVIKYIIPRIKRKEIDVKGDSIKNLISKIMNVDIRLTENAGQIGGMTNINYKIIINGKSFVLRIPGAGTEEMINRKSEKENSNLAFSSGLGTEIIYFNEDNGIKIAEFIENNETLNGSTAKKEENMKLVSEILRKLHTSGIKFNNRFNAFEQIDNYEILLCKCHGKNYDDYKFVKSKIMNLQSIMKNYNIIEAPCHNDTVPENFIKSGNNRLYLIDWEYSGMNDPMWDIAAHSLECNFSEDDEELFLRMYFNGKAENEFQSRILINKILQDFLWSLWTNIKEAKGENFGSYGIDRYNRAKLNLGKLYNKLEEGLC